jgi:hypothetical protein
VKPIMKYLINLDERTDRLSEAQLELQKIPTLGIVHRLPAVKAENGVFGCALSHMYCLAHARNNNCHAMIFEDDFLFVDKYEEVFTKCLDELDSMDWDMWYGGGNICGTIWQISESLGKLSHAQSTHHYMVNHNFINTLLLTIPSFYGKPLDLIYAEDIIPLHNCYISVPMMTIQRPSFSSIEKCFVDYSWMFDRYSSNLIPLHKD